MKIQDLKLRRITTQNAETILTERLGKGRFCEVYKDTQSEVVYIFMNEDNWCPGKEILRQCDKSPFIPTMEHFDYAETKSCFKTHTYSVWKTVYSKPLKAADKKAWLQYKTLKKAWDEAWITTTQRSTFYSDAPFYTLAENFLDILRIWNVEASLLATMEDFCSICMNYTETLCLEFCPKNLGVSADGQLVLRDIVFDREKCK